jgi:hypothetical protein
MVFGETTRPPRPTIVPGLQYSTTPTLHCSRTGDELKSCAFCAQFAGVELTVSPVHPFRLANSPQD